MRIAILLGVLLARDAAAAPSCHDRKASRADFDMTGGKLRACYAGRTTACFALDLARAGGPAWVATAPPKVSTSEEPPLVPDVTMGTTAKVCAVDGKDCHTLVTPPATVSKYIGPQIYANADRSVFAVATEEKVRLHDASGAPRATITAWPHKDSVVWSIAHVVVSGYRVYVMMRSGLDAEIRAYDVRNGSPSTNLGVVDPSDPIDLGGGRVAFAMLHGASLEVYDHDARRLRSVPLFTDQQGPVTVFARSADGKSIIVARGDNSSIALVDTTAWTASTIAPPPICP
jgi:hypothetical protein